MGKWTSTEIRFQTNLYAVVLRVSDNDLLAVPEAESVGRVEEPRFPTQLTEFGPDVHVVVSEPGHARLRGAEIRTGAPAHGGRHAHRRRTGNGRVAVIRPRVLPLRRELLWTAERRAVHRVVGVHTVIVRPGATATAAVRVVLVLSVLAAELLLELRLVVAALRPLGNLHVRASVEGGGGHSHGRGQLVRGGSVVEGVCTASGRHLV